MFNAAPLKPVRLRATPHLLLAPRPLLLRPRRCHMTTQAAAQPQSQKRAGDISDAFASLSGQQFLPLEPRYADLKAKLVHGREDAVKASWERLLARLREEIPEIVERGSKVIPQIAFGDLRNEEVVRGFREELKERGVAVVRGVVSEEEAMGWKEQIREYVRKNPQTKAFPSTNPQVFELYWSTPQLLARSHPNLRLTQQFLMSSWHTTSPSTPLSTTHPATYADRLRIRLPGDSAFALGPHVDGGSVERWDPAGYGLGNVYASIWDGRWEDFDPWEASCRLPVNSDLHQGVGACSMFRMFQGWMSMSRTGAFEGTLLVCPLLKLATVYYLLRPFFTPKSGFGKDGQTAVSESVSESVEFLDPRNWEFMGRENSWLQGATPGHGQELSSLLHPHLKLGKTMVHVPDVRPGDYVAWHCDTIHAVDKLHAGKSDSSVMYIPTCPLTEGNARYLIRQRETVIKGVPSPDFGGGVGESEHIGRVRVEDMRNVVGEEGMRAMGLAAWHTDAEGLRSGEKAVLQKANQILGF